MENTFKNKKDYIKGNDVIGLKVITVREGKELHPVQDLIYDPSNHMVRALLIDEAGLFNDAKIILFEDIKSIGDDAVMIETEELLRKASDVDQPIVAIANDNQYLTKTKIITEEGKELGKVQDIDFSPDTGRVIKLEVSQGVFSDFNSGIKMVDVDDIVTIGQDATIVRKYTEGYMEEQGQDQGLTGAVNSATEQAPGVMKDVQQQASVWAEKAREKIEEVKRHPKTKEYIGQAKKKLSDYGEETREFIEQGKQKGENAKEEAREVKDEVGGQMNDYLQSYQAQNQSQMGAMGGKSVAVRVDRHGKNDHTKIKTEVETEGGEE